MKHLIFLAMAIPFIAFANPGQEVLNSNIGVRIDHRKVDTKDVVYSVPVSYVVGKAFCDKDSSGKERICTWKKLGPDQYLLEQRVLDHVTKTGDDASFLFVKTSTAALITRWSVNNKDMGPNDLFELRSFIKEYEVEFKKQSKKAKK